MLRRTRTPCNHTSARRLLDRSLRRRRTHARTGAWSPYRLPELTDALQLSAELPGGNDRQNNSHSLANKRHKTFSVQRLSCEKTTAPLESVEQLDVPIAHVAAIQIDERPPRFARARETHRAMTPLRTQLDTTSGKRIPSNHAEKRSARVGWVRRSGPPRYVVRTCCMLKY